MPSIKRRVVKSSAGRPRRRARIEAVPSDVLTWEIISRSAAETDRLGRLVGESLEGGEILGLYGELGTGKTALVRGIAAGLDVDPAAVSSPTFVLIHEYRGRLLFAHADLYRLEGEADVQHLGLSEYLGGETVTAIEWAEKAGVHLPDERLNIYLNHRSALSRSVRLEAHGRAAERLLVKIRAIWGKRRLRVGKSSG